MIYRYVTKNTMYIFLLQIAGSMMGTQPLPPHQQPGGGGPLGLKKQQDFLGKNLTSTNEYSCVYKRYDSLVPHL